MASDTPTIPLSIRVAADTAQKFQSMATQRGLKAGSLLESLIAFHEMEQIAVPDELKAPFKKLEGVIGEIKGAWLQKDQERDAIIENQMSLQEENSKLQHDLIDSQEKLKTLEQVNGVLKIDLEKELKISKTFIDIASEYQAKIQEIKGLEALTKELDALRLQIEKLNLDKEKLEFALTKSAGKAP